MKAQLPFVDAQLPFVVRREVEKISALVVKYLKVKYPLWLLNISK